MNGKYGLLGVIVAVLALPVAGWGRDAERAFQVRNMLRVEYDDNIEETETDERSSFKIINELEFVVRFDLENTYVGLRYRPRLTWWEDRAGDSTDLHHELDVNLRQAFTPRVTLNVDNMFRYAERAEAIEDEVVIRERGDFYYNRLRGLLSYQFIPNNVLQTRAAYQLMRYDDNDVADRRDYDKYMGGVSIRHQRQPQLWLSADLDVNTLDYKGPDNNRGSDSSQLGVGVEYLVSPLSVARVNAGYQYRDFDDRNLSTASSPFVSANLTWGLTPDTRMTLGASYSLSDADVFPYASQEQARLFAGLGHDLTSKISFNVGASYTRAEYDADEAVRTDLLELGADERRLDELGVGEDGTEEYIRLSADASYRLNRNNWLTANWNFATLDSDLRRDFDRNRVGLGWRTQF